MTDVTVPRKYTISFYVNSSLEKTWRVMSNFFILNEVLILIKKTIKVSEPDPLVFTDNEEIKEITFKEGASFIFLFNSVFRFKVEITEVIESDYFCEMNWKFYNLNNNSSLFIFCKSRIQYFSDIKTFTTREFIDYEHNPFFNGFYQNLVDSMSINNLCKNIITKFANNSFIDCFNYRFFFFKCKYEFGSKLMSNPRLWFGLFETDVKNKLNDYITLTTFTAYLGQKNDPSFVNNVYIKITKYSSDDLLTKAILELTPIEGKRNFIKIPRTIEIGFYKNDKGNIFYVKHSFNSIINKEQRLILNRNITFWVKKLKEVIDFLSCKNK